MTVVCPEHLACRHVGDNLALDDTLLLTFGGRGLDGDGVILKARQHRGKLARSFGDAVAILHAGLRRANNAGDGKDNRAHDDAAAHFVRQLVDLGIFLGGHNTVAVEVALERHAQKKQHGFGRECDKDHVDAKLVKRREK